MDLPEISLWMFLVISSLSIGDCRTFPKYVVANSRISNAVNDNCFCFKYSGPHQKVTELLSHKKDNLERVVVFLYKDKSSGEVKMYIPNYEKQALVPDLAFEVGDKLKTIEGDQKIIDIFIINSRTSKDNIPNEHIHPHIDTSNEASYIDDVSYDVKHENTDTYAYELPSEEIGEPPSINVDGGIYNDQHVQPDIDSHEVTPQVIIPPVTVNVDDNDHRVPHSDVDFDESSSEEVNKPPTIHVDGGINNGEHVKPNVYPYKMPSEIKILPVPFNANAHEDDWQNNKPEVNFDKLSSIEASVPPPVNIIAKDEDYNGQYYNLSTDSFEVSSKEVHVSPITIGKVDGEEDYNGQHDKPNVDYYEKSSKEINVSPLITNVDDVDNHKKDYKPINNIYEIPSKEVKISPVTINSDDKDYHKEHDKPSIDVYKVSSQESYKPTVPINVDIGDSHEQYENPDFDPDNHQPEVIYDKPSKQIEFQENESSGEISAETSEESISNEDETRRESESSEEFTFSNEIDDNSEYLNSKGNKTKFPHHNHNKYKTFDTWFIQQMQRFKTYTEHDKAISLITIERYILNILHNNHMHVTSEGVLTDSFGTALDVHNLNLRPILIGNTMAFKNILKDEMTDLVIPENMAYLQAILVTNSHPSMILGIIPIGKTLIPPSTANAFSMLKPNQYPTWLNKGRKRINRPTYKASNTNNNLGVTSNTKYYVDNKQPIIVHLSSKDNKPVNVDRNKGRTIFTVVKKRPILVHSKYQQEKPVSNVRVYGEKTNGVNKYNLTDDSVEVFNKLIVSLQNGEDPIKSAEATNKLLASLQNGDSWTSMPKELGDNVGAQDANEDDLSGRIIGGSAATGSGTPLSVKGRMKDF